MSRIESRTTYTIRFVITDIQSDQLEEARYKSSFILFDASGNPTLEEQFDVNGNLIDCYRRSYYASGKIKTEAYETGEDGPLSLRSFVHDRDGKLLEEKGEYAQGGQEIILYNYDGDGKLISRVCLDDEEEEEFKEVFHYLADHLVEETRWEYGDKTYHKTLKHDNNGLIASIVEHNHQDGSSRSKTLEYDNGRLAVESDFVDGKILTRKTYTYDEQGRMKSLSEEEAFRRDMVLFEYDASGNLIMQEEKDRDGNILQQVERRYNEQGDLIYTDVYQDGLRSGYSQRYALQYEYVYFLGEGE